MLTTTPLVHRLRFIIIYETHKKIKRKITKNPLQSKGLLIGYLIITNSLHVIQNTLAHGHKLDKFLGQLCRHECVRKRDISIRRYHL